MFRCGRRGNIGGIWLRLCRSVAALNPLPRRVWHLRTSNQHYAVFCDGFSFAEHVARLLDQCTCPVSLFMVLGAFVFCICMQIILGYGYSVLINAGSGTSQSLFVLPFFASGSFLAPMFLNMQRLLVNYGYIFSA